MTEAGEEGWLPPDDLGGRHKAWEFVRSYVAAFGLPLAEGDGVAAADLDEAESRLGRALPITLREAHSLFGRRRDLTRMMHRLLWPHQLEIDPSGSVLVFRVENQSCTSWGVRLADLDLDDPPVVMELADDWVPYTERLSLALAEMVLFELMIFMPRADTGDNRSWDGTVADLLEAEFARVALPDMPMAGPGGPAFRWFQAPDVLVHESGGVWLWVHGRTPAALEEVRRRLPGDWQFA